VLTSDDTKEVRVLSRFRGGPYRLKITEKNGSYTVSFVLSDGGEHTATFHSRAAARAFAREVRHLPPDVPFDQIEISRLTAEYRGSFAQSVPAD
jgi:hypothetical protein